MKHKYYQAIDCPYYCRNRESICYSLHLFFQRRQTSLSWWSFCDVSAKIKKTRLTDASALELFFQCCCKTYICRPNI